jgi:hypothetical protein
VEVGAYVCVLTAASLRGNEGFYVELAGLRQHLSKGKAGSVPVSLEISKDTILSEEVCVNLPHVTVALLGQFKGETQYDHHLIAIASETQSGLESLLEISCILSLLMPMRSVHKFPHTSFHALYSPHETTLSVRTSLGLAFPPVVGRYSIQPYWSCPLFISFPGLHYAMIHWQRQLTIMLTST